MSSKQSKHQQSSTPVISFRLHSAVRYILLKIAEARGVTIQTVVRDAILYYIDNALVQRITNKKSTEEVIVEEIAKETKKHALRPHAIRAITGEVLHVVEDLPSGVVEDYWEETNKQSTKPRKPERISGW